MKKTAPSINIAINDKDLSSLEKKIAYTFSDRRLLLTALTHKSAPLTDAPLDHGPNNERLEFLGDAILSLVCAGFLYRIKPALNEGDLSRLRAQYVCQDNLGAAAKAIDLGNFIVSDKAMRSSGATNSPAILSDTLEAIFGAVLLDGGHAAAGKVVLAVLGAPSEAVDLREKDSKTKLQEYVQENYKTAPRYVVLNTQGPDHAPEFTVGVKIQNEIWAQGFGENKKTAAQNAASIALKKITEKKLSGIDL